MKKIFLTFLFLIFISIPNALASPPDIVIEHNTMSGEVSIDRILKSYLISKKVQPIYYHPSEKSPEIDKINAGEILNTVSVEMHSIPNDGKTLITDFPPDIWGNPFEVANVGKSVPVKDTYIYLLYYGGEGTYIAWYDNNIIRVSENGIKNRPYRSSSGEKIWAEYQGKSNLRSNLWICVKKKNGIEGWIKFESRNDWVNSKYTGIFLNKDFIEKNINNISWEGNFKREDNQFNFAILNITHSNDNYFKFSIHAYNGSNTGTITGIAYIKDKTTAYFDDGKGGTLKFSFNNNTINIETSDNMFLYCGLGVTFKGIYFSHKDN